MNIWNSDRICRVHCKINRLENFDSLNKWLEKAFIKDNNSNNYYYYDNKNALIGR